MIATTLTHPRQLFLSFEEAPEDLVANVAPLGFDLDDLTSRDLLVPDHGAAPVGDRHVSVRNGE